jgi:hypothetical protein
LEILVKMHGGNKAKCPKPTVDNPLSSKSWDSAFNKLNCYWKQQKIDGILPKMGGLSTINTMNNNINLTSANLNGFYQNMKRKSEAFDSAIDAKIKSMEAWGSQPI